MILEINYKDSRGEIKTISLDNYENRIIVKHLRDGITITNTKTWAGTFTPYKEYSITVDGQPCLSSPSQVLTREIAYTGKCTEIYKGYNGMYGKGYVQYTHYNTNNSLKTYWVK